MWLGPVATTHDKTLFECEGQPPLRTVVLSSVPRSGPRPAHSPSLTLSQHGGCDTSSPHSAAASPAPPPAARTPVPPPSPPHRPPSSPSRLSARPTLSPLSSAPDPDPSRRPPRQQSALLLGHVIHSGAVETVPALISFPTNVSVPRLPPETCLLRLHSPVPVYSSPRTSQDEWQVLQTPLRFGVRVLRIRGRGADHTARHSGRRVSVLIGSTVSRE